MYIQFDDHINQLDLHEALLQVTEQRRLQALQYRNELNQRQCVASYLLLSKMLQKYYGLEELPILEYEKDGRWQFSSYGKPRIQNHPEIHFNLSHAGNVVVCAIDDRPIGVDVELLANYDEEVARYVMNDDELKKITSSERPDIVFTQLWTSKESTLKLTGEGIQNDMKHVLRSDIICETSLYETFVIAHAHYAP